MYQTLGEDRLFSRARSSASEYDHCSEPSGRKALIRAAPSEVQAVNYKSVVHSVLSFERIVPHLFFNLLHMLHASKPARRSLTTAVSYACGIKIRLMVWFY